MLLEPMYTLGGTATAGGVSTYWFGNRFRDVREIDAETEKMAAPLGFPAEKGSGIGRMISIRGSAGRF